MDKKKLVVLGGGAAGFFCAVNAARLHPDINVVLIEKSTKLLSKIKVSGGGRCNVTHADFRISSMAACYPRGEKFLKKAFNNFFTNDTVDWFQNRGVQLKTEDDGRMFPQSNSSQTIIDCLLDEAAKYNVEVITSARLTTCHKRNNNFVLEFENKPQIVSDYLVIATGGFPLLKQYSFLEFSKHSIVKPVPSLFTFNIQNKELASLMGVSVNAQIKIAGTKFLSSGSILITHWGLSGPAILKLSAFAAIYLAEQDYNYKIFVNWLPDYNEQTLRQKILAYKISCGAKRVSNKMELNIPGRLWDYLIIKANTNPERRWADLKSSEINSLIKHLNADEYFVKGKTTFKEEFVTAGGISLNEVDHNTMESKLVKGLYFAGEILNIDGITGGYNFQNAWTTGYIAAKSLKQ
ncbi:MAG: NAD(P)/FAD-dependent oxidoreductase [Bacteroidetes bacterium]|nr:NAD(P)/FAD-dependent oxidoreductase [Bacteroidota bacterium]